MSTLKRGLLATIAFLAVPVLLSAQKPAKPPQPGNPAIAYEARTRQAYWDLMVMDANGANQTRLVSGGDNRVPSWSPDGEWIAFARTRVTTPGIYMVRPDGTGFCLVATTTGLLALGSPVWSPRRASNGHFKIVYADQAADFSISLFAVDAVCGGTQPQHIMTGPSSGGFPGGWSQYDVLAIGGFGGLFVHQVLLDDAGAITLGPGVNLTASGPLTGHSTLGATWTEDGTELFVAASAFQSRPDLWVISGITPGIAAQLTDTPDVAESRVSWSPDFTQFAFDENFGVILKVSAEAINGGWSIGDRVTLATPTRPIPNLGRPTWRPVW